MSDAKLIDALGGGSGLATALTERGAPLDRETIYKWKERDFIPWKWRAHVAALAEEHEISLPEDFLAPQGVDLEGGPRQPEPEPPEAFKEAS